MAVGLPLKLLRQVKVTVTLLAVMPVVAKAEALLTFRWAVLLRQVPATARKKLHDIYW